MDSIIDCFGLLPEVTAVNLRVLPGLVVEVSHRLAVAVLVDELLLFDRTLGRILLRGFFCFIGHDLTFHSVNHGM